MIGTTGSLWLTIKNHNSYDFGHKILAIVGNTEFDIKRVDEIVYAAIEYEAAGY